MSGDSELEKRVIERINIIFSQFRHLLDPEFLRLTQEEWLVIARHECQKEGTRHREKGELQEILRWNQDQYVLSCLIADYLAGKDEGFRGYIPVEIDKDVLDSNVQRLHQDIVQQYEVVNISPKPHVQPAWNIVRKNTYSKPF